MQRVRISVLALAALVLGLPGAEAAQRRHPEPAFGLSRHAVRIVRPAPWHFVAQAHRFVRRGNAPVVIGYGAAAQRPFYASTGNGFGSTGYGYGGDFSTAYTSGYDEFQTVGYGDGEGTYGGQPYGGRRYAVPSRAPAYYGRGGYGYGGPAGFSPPIQPAGGLAVYSPGAYGPGPRIVIIPSHYAPGADTLR